MADVYLWVALLLLLTLLGSAARILLGPTRIDRMMAAQLFGTTGVAVLLVLWQAMDRAVLLDVALVFALLAAMAIIAFVRRAGYLPDVHPEPTPETLHDHD